MDWVYYYTGLMFCLSLVNALLSAQDDVRFNYNILNIVLWLPLYGRIFGWW